MENNEPSLSNDEMGRVSISTIRRAKGLEWSDVYVPYFNQGFMPMGARNDDDETEEQHEDVDQGKGGRRHLPNCISAMQCDRCDKSCARRFQDMY